MMKPAVPPRVAVVGLGFVGLPLALTFCQRGRMSTLGIDVDLEKVRAIEAGRSYIRHVDAAPIAEAVREGLLSTAVDLSRASSCDAADALDMVSVPLTAEALEGADAVLIATDHSCIDYAWVAEKARLVIDTRNACRGAKSGRGKIVKA